MKLSYLAGNKPGYFNCCDNLARKNIIQTRTVFNICIILKYCICSRKYNNLKFTNEIESLLLLLLLLTIIKLDILNLKSNVNSGKMINNEVKNFSIENIDAFHAIYNIHIDRIKYDAFAFRLFLRLVAAKRTMIKIKHNNRKIGCNRCIDNILYVNPKKNNNIDPIDHMENK